MSHILYVSFCFFFFQAEDGIRDVAVTGVQTCALPICIFWLVLSRLWKGWRNSWRVVRPETVVGWHRQGVRRYWAWERRRRRGRPMIRTDLPDFIRRMSPQSSPGFAEDPRRPSEARPGGIAGRGEAAFS